MGLELQDQSVTDRVSDDNTYWVSRIDEHVDVIQSIREAPLLLSQLTEVGTVLVNAFKSGHKLLICGNGGSAADSQHLAGELVSRFFLERPGLHAEALSGDIASITAIGNDYSYDRIFARQVEAKGQRGDVLIGISTSGRSVNVIKALDVAEEKGMIRIGITGSAENTEICKADHCIQLPSTSTPRIQEAYLLVGHMLCEYVEDRLFNSRP